jgi:hypothetical protein
LVTCSRFSFRFGKKQTQAIAPNPRLQPTAYTRREQWLLAISHHRCRVAVRHHRRRLKRRPLGRTPLRQVYYFFELQPTVKTNIVATESLESSIIEDAKILDNLGISHKQVADALETVLSSVQEQYWQHEFDRRTDYPKLTTPRCIPDFSLDNLPSTDKGYLFGELQGFITQWRGFQECPWGCDVEPSWWSFDFLLLNRTTGEFITGPGMIVHLVREHHFFEGMESPYRTDPVKAIRVLGCVRRSHSQIEETA